jgi:hypothetical protein
VSKTYKESEERMALSKNNGDKIRYRKRKQQELEASQEQKEAMRRLAEYDAQHGFGRTEYED